MVVSSGQVVLSVVLASVEEVVVVVIAVVEGVVAEVFSPSHVTLEPVWFTKTVSQEQGNTTHTADGYAGHVAETQADSDTRHTFSGFQ